MKKQHLLLICLAATVMIGLLWQLVPLKDASNRLKTLPLNGLNFSGKEIPLTKQEKNIFKQVNVVKRFYRIGDHNYFVTVLDGTKNRHAVHDPSYCFAGGGWKIINDEEIQTPKGEIKKVTLERDNNLKQALYWFSNGKKTYTSPLEFWKETTLRRLSLGLYGEEPVLIMVQPINTHSPNSDEMQQKFQALFSL